MGLEGDPPEQQAFSSSSLSTRMRSTSRCSRPSDPAMPTQWEQTGPSDHSRFSSVAKAAASAGRKAVSALTSIFGSKPPHSFSRPYWVIRATLRA